MRRIMTTRVITNSSLLSLNTRPNNRTEVEYRPSFATRKMRKSLRARRKRRSVWTKDRKNGSTASKSIMVIGLAMKRSLPVIGLEYSSRETHDHTLAKYSTENTATENSSKRCKSISWRSSTTFTVPMTTATTFRKIRVRMKISKIRPRTSPGFATSNISHTLRLNSRFT